MQAFGVLDRYIGKTIFNTIMMTLFMLVSLSGIIKFVDQLKKSGQGSYDALGAGLTPSSACRRTSRSSSQWRRCWRAAGAGDAGPAQRTGGDAGIRFHPAAGSAGGNETAIPLVLLTMAIGEWVAPQGEQMARNYRAQQMYGGSLLSTSRGCGRKMATTLSISNA